MRTKFILLVLLQVALLVGIIAYRQYWVATGEKILLRTAPVDPRDLFRGDYVSLRYEISELRLDKLNVEEEFILGDKIYVVLEKAMDGTFQASSVTKRLPREKKFIQGQIRQVLGSAKCEISLEDDLGNIHPIESSSCSGIRKGDRVTFCFDQEGRLRTFFKEDQKDRDCRSLKSLTGVINQDIKFTRFKELRVEYGIESYFVEEGKGRAIESSRNARDLCVEVSLRKDGKGIITGLFMGGKLVR